MSIAADIEGIVLAYERALHEEDAAQFHLREATRSQEDAEARLNNARRMVTRARLTLDRVLLGKPVKD